MKFTAIISFYCILQVIVSMQSNIISDNNFPNDANNVAALNVDNNNQGLVLNQQNSDSKKTIDIISQPWFIFKYIFLHRNWLLFAGCADLFFVVAYQPSYQKPLGLWVDIQYLTFVARFMWPNFGCCKFLNRVALAEGISTPKIKEADIIHTPDVMDTSIRVPLINEDGTIENAQQQSSLRHTKCELCKKCFAHVLMNEYVFFVTTLLAFGWSYGLFVLGYSDGDFFTLSIWMSLQIFKLIYFLRTKCPNTFIGSYLNQWALDIGCIDTSELQNINPLQKLYRPRNSQENGNFQEEDLNWRATQLLSQGIHHYNGLHQEVMADMETELGMSPEQTHQHYESVYSITENPYSSFEEVSNAVKELGLFNGEYWIGTDQEIYSAAERHPEIRKKLIETARFNSSVMAADPFLCHVAELLKQHEEYTYEVEKKNSNGQDTFFSDY